jgi:hypothetical protein
MARATFINAVLSGKLDGQVYARNKGGAYVRAWVKPTNPKTQQQASVRSAFSDISKTFSAFNARTKEQWNYFATSYFKPKKIKPGVIYSGFNAFQSLMNAQKQAQRNYRSTTIPFPATTTATSTNIEVNSVIPEDVFSGQPVDGNGDSLPITLVAGNVSSIGEVNATFQLGRPVDMADVMFQDIGGNRQIGFLLYGNVPNSSSPTENVCLGFSGFLEISTSTATNVTEFSIRIADSGFSNVGRKMWYTTGQSLIMSAYAISTYGELSYLGNIKTTAG